MLLCAVRNQLAKEGLAKLAKGLHRLIECPDINDHLQFVLQTETSYPFLQEYIQKFGVPDHEVQIGEEERRLQSGFSLLTNYVEGAVAGVKSDTTLNGSQKRKRIEAKLCDIRDVVLHLKVIVVVLQNEDARTRFLKR